MTKCFLGFALLATLSVAHGQYKGPQTTPVPILKQINRHNEDGSYSYGYEAADGSFKIETKHPTGEVYGKYGYVDDSGQLREVEYGASRRGFEPAGTGINVPPPTLTNSYSSNSVSDGYDDGQYHEDPSVYYKNPNYANSRPRFNSPTPRPQYNPPPPPPAATPAPQRYYNPPPQNNNYYNPPPPQNNYYNPPPQNNYYNNAPRNYQVDPNLFRGHPATNFDVNSGSYSITYTGRR